MNVFDLMRVFFAAIVSLVLIVVIYGKEGKGWSSQPQKGTKRYAAIVSPLIFPIALMIYLLIFIAVDEVQLGVIILGPVLLHASAYYCVLLLFLPLLRRKISARCIAMLWLLPSWLYLMIGGRTSTFGSSEPIWVLRTDYLPWKALTILWAAGVLLVLCGKIWQHMQFRRMLLQNAEEVREAETLLLWEEIQHQAGMEEAKLVLLRSAVINTPLSVGLFQNTIRVILLERSFTEDELRLILRHELVHILRSDSQTKLLLVLFTALNWFNPLMWIAMRKCAEDLELSCDEYVLEQADAQERRQYAELLLHTAGDERGFTTCLSAKAKTLRYRLRQVVNPRKRWIGGFLVGISFALMLLSTGYVAISYETVTGDEVFFAETDKNFAEIRSFHERDGKGLQFYTCTDPEAMKDYLSQLELSRIIGQYAYEHVLDESRDGLYFDCWNGEGVVQYYLEEGMLVILHSDLGYRLNTPADMELVRGMLVKDGERVEF